MQLAFGSGDCFRSSAETGTGLPAAAPSPGKAVSSSPQLEIIVGVKLPTVPAQG